MNSPGELPYYTPTPQYQISNSFSSQQMMHQLDYSANNAAFLPQFVHYQQPLLQPHMIFLGMVSSSDEIDAQISPKYNLTMNSPQTTQIQTSSKKSPENASLYLSSDLHRPYCPPIPTYTSPAEMIDHIHEDYEICKPTVHPNLASLSTIEILASHTRKNPPVLNDITVRPRHRTLTLSPIHEELQSQIPIVSQTMTLPDPLSIDTTLLAMETHDIPVRADQHPPILTLLPPQFLQNPTPPPKLFIEDHYSQQQSPNIQSDALMSELVTSPSNNWVQHHTQTNTCNGLFSCDSFASEETCGLFLGPTSTRRRSGKLSQPSSLYPPLIRTKKNEKPKNLSVGQKPNKKHELEHHKFDLVTSLVNLSISHACNSHCNDEDEDSTDIGEVIIGNKKPSYRKSNYL